MKKRILVLLSICCLGQFASAQMGSPGHGETQAVALHPTDPMILYAGAAKGLCKTIKGGKDNWPTVGLDTFSPRAIVVGQKLLKFELSLITVVDVVPNVVIGV